VYSGLLDILVSMGALFLAVCILFRTSVRYVFIRQHYFRRSVRYILYGNTVL
jgi:hypothetical protein